MATTSANIPNDNMDESPRHTETDTPRENVRGDQFNDHEAPPPQREESRHRPPPPNQPQYQQENGAYDEPLPRRRYAPDFQEQFNNPLYDMPPRQQQQPPRQRIKAYFEPRYDEEYYEPQRPRRNEPRNVQRNQPRGEERRTIADYMTPDFSVHNSIYIPPVEANNFQINSAVITLVQNQPFWRIAGGGSTRTYHPIHPIVWYVPSKRSYRRGCKTKNVPIFFDRGSREVA